MSELETLMLINACKPIDNVIPTARSLPYMSLALEAIIIPLCINVQNKPIIKRQPKNPSSSAITAKIKSVCPSGSHASFCFEFP